MLPAPDTLRHGMAHLHLGRQTARSFRDDLKAASDGVKRPHIGKEAFVVESLGEVSRKVDIEKYVGQADAFGFRKHKLRQRSPLAAQEVSGLRCSRHRPGCR